MPQEQNWALNVPQTFVIDINKQDLQKQDEELITYEKVLAELKKLRTQTDALQNQVNLLNNTIDIYKRIDDARDLEIKYLKSAIDARDKYGNLADKKEELYKQETQILKDQIDRLTAENKELKRSRLLTKIGSTVMTLATVFLATR